MKSKKENVADYSERPNKSAEKRIYQERFSLIAKAVNLSGKELKKLGFNDSDLFELSQLKAMKPSNAKKRQLKFCVKAFSQKDLNPLRTYLSDKQSQILKIKQNEKFLSNYCDKLIEFGDEEISEVLRKIPNLDRQHLRNLVRSYESKPENKKLLAKKKFLDYLREESGEFIC